MRFGGSMASCNLPKWIRSDMVDSSDFSGELLGLPTRVYRLRETFKTSECKTPVQAGRDFPARLSTD